MAAMYLGSTKIRKMFLGSEKIKKAYVGDTQVYSGATVVQYIVDSGVSYTEEVDEGSSVLLPATFTPAKSGYIFLGWRMDNTASSDVLSSKTAEGETMTLYAVFYKAITVTLYNASNTASSLTGRQYYNNGDILNPTFTLAENAITGWSKAGWTTTTSGYSATVADGGSVTLSADATYYSLYTQTITVTYYNNSSTASTKTGTRIANIHATTTYSNPSFTLTVASVSGWTIRGWSTGSGASASISYSSGVAFTRSSNVTLYASWSKTITVTYYNNSSTASSSNGTAYRNYAGSVSGASFTLTQTAKSGWVARGWTTATSGGASSISYSSGVAFTRTSNVTLYGCYYRTVTVSYNGNGNTGGSTSASTGTAYYHSTSGATNASISLRANGFSKTSYIFRRWRAGSASGTAYNAGATYASTADITMYAEWVIASKTFNYTGGMQYFTALAGVTYRIQCYGAKGGNGYNLKTSAPVGYGANGAYTIGYRTPSSDETWYLYVGGQGGDSSAGWNGSDVYSGGGGYNGGGSGLGDHQGNYYRGAYGGGGGASSVATSNAAASGANLMVAGGGGGGTYNGYNGADTSSNGSTSASSNGVRGSGTAAASGQSGAAGGGGYYGGNRGYAGTNYTGGTASASTSQGQNAGAGSITITAS